MIAFNLRLKKKAVYICVTNDLAWDQRVDRTARFFHDAGHRVVLVGRRLPYRKTTVERAYATFRFRLPCNKGFLFYACFNIRLFCYLLCRPTGLIVANDLDTLTACYLVSRLRKRPLLYDSHELFPEVPELRERDFVRKCWLFLEKRLLPRLRYCMTVSDSIATHYASKYGTRMAVVRNLPDFRSRAEIDRVRKATDLPVIIYQGALNLGRGLEAMILAMKHLEDYRFHILGDGDIRRELEALVREHSLYERVNFLGHRPFGELLRHTASAALGISLEEDLGLSYRYALPNKLFNYIRARIPVLVSDLPEMKALIGRYGVGTVLRQRDPETIARTVRQMTETVESRRQWEIPLEKAAEELCWEKEREKLAGLVAEIPL